MTVCLFTPEISERLLRWRWPLLALWLAVLTYLAGASIYYQWLAPVSDYPVVKTAGGNRSGAWVMFGARASSSSAAVVEENISAARIKAKLLGIVEQETDSLAIIDLGRRGESQVFRDGDKLSASVTVFRIEAGRVLINEQGAIRSLSLESKRSDAINLQDTEAMVLPDVGDDESYEESLLGTRAADVALPDDNGLELMQIETGETGMSLAAVNSAMLQGTPLRSSDVVLQIEGSPIPSLLGNSGAARSLLNREQVSVDIWRDGTVQTVTIKPNVIAPAVISLMANQNP